MSSLGWIALACALFSSHVCALMMGAASAEKGKDPETVGAAKGFALLVVIFLILFSIDVAFNHHIRISWN